MSDPQTLIEQLRRSNRRWKAFALAACLALIFVAYSSTVAMSRQRLQAEVALREAEIAKASADVARFAAQPR